MRTFKKAIAIITIFTMLQSTSASVIITYDTPICFEELPKMAQHWIKTTFRNKSVTRASYNNTSPTSCAYEVTLSDNTYIGFDEIGEWKEIRNQESAIPHRLIPAPIASYVRSHYPQARIYKIKRTPMHLEVTLTTQHQLAFDRQFRATLVETDGCQVFDE